jgi:hypothetical protein
VTGIIIIRVEGNNFYVEIEKHRKAEEDDIVTKRPRGTGGGVSGAAGAEGPWVRSLNFHFQDLRDPGSTQWWMQSHEFTETVRWNQDGNSFIIENIERFEEEILPVYFRHRNFSSFVRQLNMYDFHKIRNEGNLNIF